MISFDEDSLVCDLAETYQIYDYRQLPPTRVAVFSYGLRDDSRIKMAMNDQKVDIKTILLASIADSLKTLIWFETEDAQKRRNRPKSIAEMLTSTQEKTDKEVVAFSSGEDFIKLRERLIKGGE